MESTKYKILGSKIDGSKYSENDSENDSRNDSRNDRHNKTKTKTKTKERENIKEKEKAAKSPYGEFGRVHLA